jgi:hypothetical protein
MTDLQAHEIIDDCIKAHWPAWDFKGRELAVWVEELRKFDFHAARDGIDACYRDWDGKQYPRMKSILRYIRTRTKSRVQASGIREHYKICRADGRLRWRPFWGLSNLPQQDIEEGAIAKLERANIIEPGHYIVWPKREANVPF